MDMLSMQNMQEYHNLRFNRVLISYFFFFSSSISFFNFFNSSAFNVFLLLFPFHCLFSLCCHSLGDENSICIICKICK